MTEAICEHPRVRIDPDTLRTAEDGRTWRDGQCTACGMPQTVHVQGGEPTEYQQEEDGTWRKQA